MPKTLPQPPTVGKTLPKPPSTVGKVPPGKGDFPGLGKKYPDLFPKQPPALGKDFGRPGRPSGGDLDHWLNLPNTGRPGRPGPGPGIATRPVIHQGFQNNLAAAVKKGNINIGNKYIKTGDRITNINLSNNINYQQLRPNYAAINHNFRPYRNDWFHGDWWNHHHHTWPWWHYHHFRPAGWWWRPVAWTTATAWLGATLFGPPAYYDYGYAPIADSGGTSVVIQQDVVYVNNEPVASAPVYAQQAIALADVPPPPQDSRIEWLPLGTFALSAKKDDDNPSSILQLALSKGGLISGTWFNRQTDASEEVEGKVDPETQRVALRKPSQPDVVLEVGLYNLTQEASACLIHFGTLRTQTWYLTRLEGSDANPPE